MFTNFPFFPQQASAQAAQVDGIYFFMVAVTAFFSLLIASLLVLFAIKYHRRHEDEVGVEIHGALALELLWTIIPFAITMVMFVWGAKVFFDSYRPPAGAMEIYIVGKQWMWKAQHLDGQREINELHVPVGRPVKLTMGSEDVLHSFYIPAFRVKADVIPGRDNVLWFTAIDRVGPSRASVFANLQPFLAAIIALLLLNEKITTLEVVGGLAIGAGIVLAPRGASAPEPPAE